MCIVDVLIPKLFQSEFPIKNHILFHVIGTVITIKKPTY